MIPIINQIYLISLHWFFIFVERLYHFIMSYKKDLTIKTSNKMKNIKLINKKPFVAVKIIKRKKPKTRN
jgi:hypothetical protein